MSLELLPAYIERVEEFLSDELQLNEFIKEIEESLLPEHIAIFLEAFPISERLSIWGELTPEYQQAVFLEMKNESRQMLLNALDDDICLPLFDKLDANSLLELTEGLSERFVEYAITQMTSKQSAYFKEAQDYSDIELGRWQNFDEIRVSKTLKVSAAKKACSKNESPLTDVIYVIDNNATLLGEIAISKLLVLEDDIQLSSLIYQEVHTL
jgi:magnesium transporter